MKEIFDSLTQSEKRILEVFLVLLVLSIAFLFFIGLKEKGKYAEILSSISSKEREYQKLNVKKLEKKRDWLKWRKAVQDMKELGENYFYDEKQGINMLRLDLQRFLDESRIKASQIKYNFYKFEKEKINKVNLTFNLTGSYFALKKFINSVEKYQKFLIIEKIDFLNTSADKGPLKFKITLAGYYNAE